jgi:hypothetical protein
VVGGCVVEVVLLLVVELEVVLEVVEVEVVLLDVVELVVELVVDELVVELVVEELVVELLVVELVLDVVVLGATVVVVVDGLLPTYVTTPPTMDRYVPTRIGTTCNEGVASNELSILTTGLACCRMVTWSDPRWRFAIKPPTPYSLGAD